MKRTKTTYRPETRERALRAYRAACTEEEVASIVGCSPDTLRRWKTKHPDFAEAVRVAKSPTGSDELLAKAEQRRQWAEDAIDEYLRTKLAKRIVCTGDGDGNYTKEEFWMLPDKWLMERILGPAVPAETEFNVVITRAHPDFDDDEEMSLEEFMDDIEVL